MAVNSVRLPRLLRADLSERTRLTPTALSYQLQLRAASTANMTLSEYDLSPAIHDWVELFTTTRSIGLFRVVSLSHTPRQQRTAVLRHGIDTLSDNVWRQRNYDYEGTVADFLRQLLAYQTRVCWQLGTVEDEGAYKRGGIHYNKLSELLWELAEARHGYYVAYDFSTSPWTLHFLRLSDTPAAEWRLSRNVRTCQVQRSDEELCTRLHVTVNTTTVTPVADDPENTVKTTETELRTYDNAAAQAVYGIVEKTADIDTADVGDPDAWARQYLADRSEPSVQITIDGYELARATNESWDEMIPGKLTRCCLPESGETLMERIMTVSYTDALGEGERVTVELANKLAKVSDMLARVREETARATAAAKSAGRGGGSSTKDLEHWAMIVQKAVEALDGTGLTALYETGIVLDPETGATIYTLGQGFESQYSELVVQRDRIATLVRKTGIDEITGEAETLFSRIEQTQDSITAEVGRAQGVETEIGTRIEQTMTAIALQAGRIDAQGELIEGAQVTIDGLSGEISQKVSKNGVISEINQTSESVRISASKINLDGYVTARQLEANYVTASQLEAEVADLETLISSGALFDGIAVNYMAIGSCWLENVSWETTKVITGVSRSLTTRDITDADGNSYRVVTDVSLNINSKEITYLRH